MKLFYTFLATIFFSLGIHAQSFERTIAFEPPKTGESLYRYVPFDVPPATESLSFSFEYDRKGGANRLEFGVFDARFSGNGSDKNGFRGWSGSVRDAAFISRATATRGYSAGEIPAGKWFFIVGLARLAPAGVALKLKVKFNEIEEKPRREWETENAKKFSFDRFEKPAPFKIAGLTWFRGDLHTHNFHGDGSWSVKAILDSARANGLDFVALTEHNTFSHHREIEAERKNYPGLLIIRGEEVTTHGGHINIWGLPLGGWVDFRVAPQREASARQIAAEARRFGALASINHPTMNCGGCTWTYDETWENLDSVEIWNATWDADDEKALRTWDEFLQNGRVVTAVGSSDSHQPPYEASPYPTNLRIGEPCVFIGAKSLKEKGLLEAIKNGRVFIAENPRYAVEFTADRGETVGDKIRVGKNQKVRLEFSLRGFPPAAKVKLISGGKTIKESEITNSNYSGEYVFDPADARYVRLEVRSPDGKMLAMTNPIYFRQS